MVARVIFIIAGVFAFFGLAYVLLSLFAVRSVENGVSLHIIDGSGIARGAFLLVVALVFGLIAFAVRPAH
ncbi:MAG TPA: hypothetical protein VFW17_16380 [Ktedonobacterales bacterium]|nr:hypothetical protein [Ktedonobacterales bacterium]